MHRYRPLRCGLFVYDSLRAAAIAAVLCGAAEGGGREAALLPLLAYAAPNMLFPLAALFLWKRPGRYPAYTPLYLAGKMAAVLAGAVWLLLSARRLMIAALDMALLRNIPALAILGSTGLLLFLDGLSILGALMILRSDSTLSEGGSADDAQRRNGAVMGGGV